MTVVVWSMEDCSVIMRQGDRRQTSAEVEGSADGDYATEVHDKGSKWLVVGSMVSTSTSLR